MTKYDIILGIYHRLLRTSWQFENWSDTYLMTSMNANLLIFFIIVMILPKLWQSVFTAMSIADNPLGFCLLHLGVEYIVM